MAFFRVFCAKVSYMAFLMSKSTLPLMTNLFLQFHTVCRERERVSSVITIRYADYLTVRNVSGCGGGVLDFKLNSQYSWC